MSMESMEEEEGGLRHWHHTDSASGVKTAENFNTERGESVTDGSVGQYPVHDVLPPMMNTP